MPTSAAAPAAPTSHPASDEPRRAFSRACTIGAAFGILLFVWLLSRGTFDLLEWQRVGDFYDAQAHAFLGGHLAVDGRLLGVEAFTIDGNAYMYQGPVPALLRLPVVAIAGNALDGRLTQLSMIAALVVTTIAVCRLHWKIRSAVRGPAAVARSEAWLVGLFTFVVTGGSVLLFEASRAWVYHEALLWGVAFALASIDAMIELARRPTVRMLVASSGFAACALLTRASVGLGPVLGLALLALGATVMHLWGGSRAPSSASGSRRHRFAARLRWLAPGDVTVVSRAWSAALAAATIAPVALYALVNYAKFGTLFSVPFEAQQFSIEDPERQRFLAENGGTLFGLQFAPSTVLQYLRPDALRLTSTFPFVDFPPFPGTIVGDVRFDLFDRTSSLPAAVPFLCVLGVGGLIFLARRRSWSSSALHHLRVPFLAAIGCALAILPFGYVANRYLADFLPALVFAAAVGLQVLLRRMGDGPVRWARPATVALALLAALTLWVNLGLGLRYQRAWSYNVEPAVLAGFVGFQADVSELLGGDPPPVERGTTLPRDAPAGELFVLGDCDALYLSDGLDVNAFKTSPWSGVERTGAAGHFSLRVTFPPRPVGTRVPIFTTGPRRDPNILLAEYRADSSILFEYREPGEELVRRYLPVPFEPGTEYRLDVVADWRVELLTVRLDDVVVLDAFYRFEGDDFRLGRNDGVPGVTERFPGRFTRVKAGTPLCRSLVDAPDAG